MNCLERAMSGGHAKFSGDPNNDIQPVSKESLIAAIKKCHQTIWAGGKLSSLAHRPLQAAARHATNSSSGLPEAKKQSMFCWIDYARYI